MNQNKFILLENGLNDIQKEVKDSLAIIRKLIKDMTGDSEEDGELYDDTESLEL